jgi:hypothetical protein
MNKIEQLVVERRRSLTAFLVAFVAWQLPQVVEAYSEQGVPSWLNHALDAAIALGALAYIYSCWRLMRTLRRIRHDPSAQSALLDERFQLTRLRAASFGFYATVAALAVHFALIHAFALETKAALQTCLLVAVASAGSYMLWAERGLEDE